MIIEKKELQNNIQLCINSYKDEYGKFIRVLDREYNFIREHIEYQVGLKDNDTTLYVIFQGSSSWNDWKDNFKFWKINFLHHKEHNKKISPYFYLEYSEKVKIHQGVAEQYYLIQEDLLTFIDELIRQFPTINKIKITGHSLGGGLALLCWNDFKDQQKWNNRFKDFDISSMYFGALKIGNRHFIKELKSKGENCVDVIYRDDIVPKVPLWIMGYRRFGYKLIVFKKRPWWKNILLCYRKITGTAFDHYPEKYKCAIDKLPEQISIKNF